MSEKKSIFWKSELWCQKRGSPAKITTGLYFLGQKLRKRKNAFLKIFKILRSYNFFSIRQNPGWLRGLSLKTVSALNRRTWWCCPLKIHSEPERLGQVDLDDMTKRANFCAFLSLLWVKSIADFFVFEPALTTIWQTRGTTVSGKHLICLITCREGKLLTC